MSDQRPATSPDVNLVLLKIDRTELAGRTCRLDGVIDTVIEGADYRIGDRVRVEVACELRRGAHRAPTMTQERPVFDAVAMLSTRAACARLDARGKIIWRPTDASDLCEGGGFARLDEPTRRAKPPRPPAL